MEPLLIMFMLAMKNILVSAMTTLCEAEFLYDIGGGKAGIFIFWIACLVALCATDIIIIAVIEAIKDTINKKKLLKKRHRNVRDRA